MTRKKYSNKTMFGIWDRNESEFLEAFYVSAEKAEYKLRNILKNEDFYAEDDLTVKETEYDGRWDKVK